MAIQRAAAWLDRRAQLGRDVFGRGRASESTTAVARVADITDLFRAVACAGPGGRVPAASASVLACSGRDGTITRLLSGIGDMAELGLFLPAIDRSAPERELRCRTALASTFLAGLELAREGAVRLEQSREWQAIIVQDAKVADTPREDRAALETGTLRKICYQE